jgi:outer membrane immunogenic protein
MPGGAYKWQIESQLNSLATLRGKLGVSLGPVLVYGTGGFAIASFQSDKEVTSNDGHPWQVTARDSATDNHVGFVYGAGAEWMIANGLSVKAEYLHVDLGEEDGQFEGTRHAIKPATGEFPYSSDSFRGDVNLDIFRAGVNYRF